MNNAQNYSRIIRKFICTKREKTGMSQEIVAKQTGISRSKIAKYETGESEMNVSVLPLLCSAYDCRVTECALELDEEICNENIRTIIKNATDSPFMPTHYMQLMTGAKKPKEEIPSIEEDEFSVLIRHASAYVKNVYELYSRTDTPSADAERLVSNFSLFMLEFIEYNEPRKEVKKRLQKIYREELAKIFVDF